MKYSLGHTSKKTWSNKSDVFVITKFDEHVLQKKDYLSMGRHVWIYYLQQKVCEISLFDSFYIFKVHSPENIRVYW